MKKKLYELPLGLYEKALPPIYFNSNTWVNLLSEAKNLGFNFVEMSIDESLERQERLKWKKQDVQNIINAKLNTNIRIPSICLSCHREKPFGSASIKLRKEAMDMMKRAIDLSDKLGVRVIQLAGYDVYYEKAHNKSFDYFLEGMQDSVNYAAGAQVTLAMEIMDTSFMNSVSKFLSFQKRVSSPWMQVYPDLGNVSAWSDSTERARNEIISGIEHTVAIHLKDTYKVSTTSKGQFRDVPFGKGCVDFDAMFSTLKEIQFQGPFLIEMWSRKDLVTARRDIVKIKTWLQNKMKKAYN